ncbi:MAG: YgfZ/GcvT domain-containing protein [Acidobacteriaceae bacterium]
MRWNQRPALLRSILLISQVGSKQGAHNRSMPTPDHQELSLLQHAAGFAPVEDRAFLRITGSDATRWLNGMVSNSVKSLQPGEGNYNFLLNAQGRIQGDATIYRETGTEPATFLLATSTSQLEDIRSHLDRFIIMDDVELQQPEGYPAGLLLVGRQAGTVLESLGLPVLEPLRLTLAETPHGHLLLLTPTHAQTPVYELRSTPATLRTLRSALQRLQLPQVSADTLECLRLLEARPLFGKDIRNTETAHDLPQETGQTHALHFAKGCYLGQEIVERIRSRGQVHRSFTAFRLQGEPPAELPAPIQMAGKLVGELTSAGMAPLPEGPVLLGLGYLRQQALDARLRHDAPGSGQDLTYPGGLAIPRT